MSLRGLPLLHGRRWGIEKGREILKQEREDKPPVRPIAQYQDGRLSSTNSLKFE